ncbi:complement C1q tumor necrosis factor-related protein 3-like [Saccostrea cucullata]|uniref:complement C1q tumor necrosis factor-related protein 3-like n=1 Tax=Saccostrea cuccullata TaxID=36930 RepID=UPI002ED3B284
MFQITISLNICLSLVAIALCSCPCKKNLEYYNICMKSAQNSNNACGLHLTEYDTCTKERYTHLESKVESIERSLNRKTHHVSFMANPSGNVKVVKGTLIFSNVLTNKGGAYNGKTGIFTAPVSGSYFFMVTFGLPTPSGSKGSDYIRMQIIKNGKMIGYLFIGTEGVWIKRSENTLIDLSKGDKVKLSIITIGTGFSYIAGGYRSHFSGFLIN